MHELKEFVDNSLEKAPVSSEEARVLPDNIHDVGSNDSFVVLAAFLLTET